VVQFWQHNYIWVGSPTILSISGPTYVEVNTSFGQSYYAQNISGSPTSYDWKLNNGTNYVVNCDDYAKIYFTYEGSFSVSARGTNSCGDGAWVYLNNIWAYNYSPSPAYPNPTSNVVNIEVGKSSSAKSQGSSLTYDVRLYDGQGNLLRNANSKGGTIQFNVSNLPNGVYYLHLFDGVSNMPEIHQIIVEH